MSLSHAHFNSIELQNKRLQPLSRRGNDDDDQSGMIFKRHLGRLKVLFLLREVQKDEAILT